MIIFVHIFILHYTFLPFGDYIQFLCVCGLSHLNISEYNGQRKEGVGLFETKKRDLFECDVCFCYVDVMHDACREDLTECEVSIFLHTKPVKKMLKTKIKKLKTACILNV